MAKKRTLVGYCVALLVGLALFLLGLFLLTRTVDVDEMRFWVPVFLILMGIFILPEATARRDWESSDQPSTQFSAGVVVAASMLGIGVFLLFRQFGIIDAPILQYLVGGGLVIIGLYGMVPAVLAILSKPPARPDGGSAG